MKNSVAFKTMSIKARLANLLRKELYIYSTNDFEIKYRGKKKITEEEKIKLFDQFFKACKEMHTELSEYKEKRRYKAKVQKLREEKKSLEKAK